MTQRTTSINESAVLTKARDEIMYPIKRRCLSNDNEVAGLIRSELSGYPMGQLVEIESDQGLKVLHNGHEILDISYPINTLVHPYSKVVASKGIEFETSYGILKAWRPNYGFSQSKRITLIACDDDQWQLRPTFSGVVLSHEQRVIGKFRLGRCYVSDQASELDCIVLLSVDLTKLHHLSANPFGRLIRTLVSNI